MELRVGSGVAVLAPHKTYRDDSDSTVKDVATFTPFRNYIAACNEHGPVPCALLIRNVRRMAQRVVGVIMDVECNTATGKTVQTVELTDASPAILLPVVVVVGVEYALLLHQRRVSVGCDVTVEAFCGVENSDGTFSWENEHFLTALGFDMKTVRVCGANKYTVGNEGQQPYRVCSVSASMDLGALETLQKSSKDSTSVSLLAVRLEEVVTSVNDAKASLAASLLLYGEIK
ncbi:hypothetical protein ERJ75_000929500 [Trypanosoma vivax]|uniref:Uncharacterized protein n=1 Tax=Trypanosoma vivax (strain Y486) TaxID=1055687 RepID=G0U406_TRYVY|nr:hypothetical protein TRVL_02126 [Trypanosoma vivax]KAH8612063.1 hypothetical protein ERJ75_000929500 [Trypanosoma vivax]CCC52168.1 conserved hypothetical protein [Trypanosoma vivax Y486]